MRFPFNLRLFPLSVQGSNATGSYPNPPTERQIGWTPEDGFPAGDESLVLPEGENPFTPDWKLTDEVPS